MSYKKGDTGQLLLAINGFKGSGKSTVAKILVESYGFRRVALAGPLKDMLRAIGCSEEELEGTKKEVPSAALMGLTPRHAMVTLGTEWGRKCIHPDFWAEKLVDAIATANGPLVCDDCRYPNEAKILRGCGAKFLRVHRPEKEPGPTWLPWTIRRWFVHPSERYVYDLPADFEIWNTQTVVDLEQALAATVASLKRP